MQHQEIAERDIVRRDGDRNTAVSVLSASVPAVSPAADPSDPVETAGGSSTGCANPPLLVRYMYEMEPWGAVTSTVPSNADATHW